MPMFTPPLDYLHTLDRYRFLTILNAARECDEFQFAKQATMLWLVNFPGDLFVKYLQAVNFEKLGKRQQAINQLKKLIEQDPFFIEPNKALKEISSSEEKQAYYNSLLSFLMKEPAKSDIKEKWLLPIWNARIALQKENFYKANNLIHQSLLDDPPSPIPAVMHLKTAYKMGNQEMMNNLSEIYLQKWPKCLQINVIKAISEMDQDQESAAVERLHYVAAHDSAGQVVTRLMGSQHRFRSLWPDRMEIYFDLPIPASVSTYLGWNQLGSGWEPAPDFKGVSAPNHHDTTIGEPTQKIVISREPASKQGPAKESGLEDQEKEKLDEEYASQEELEEIQEAFSKLAKRLKKKDLERADNRFPIYVVMTSKKQLVSTYGPNTAAVIDEQLNKLVNLIQKLPDWGAVLFYPDDPTQMAHLGLKPNIADDAWQVKLSLADLDASLSKQGEMIGALLIVGGPEIVPFHQLPNPTNDTDLDVASDNPYSTIDENYFIPQWPVGRLPGETGDGAGLLLTQIRHLIYQYEKRSKSLKLENFDLSSILNWVLNLFSLFKRETQESRKFGYAAEIWQEASKGVYKSVGKPKALNFSPPLHSGNVVVNNGHKLSLGYFNLHGVEDGPHWYGQKDFSSEASGPDYPIALSPTMFNDNTRSPELVFTEACYGANIYQKNYDESMSLKFIDSGTSSFVGSTCIAYGSVTLPLIAADYLAEKFWNFVTDGQPAGYALMQAKLSLAEEMVRLQGFLDGEDQKTILSFVLYGDPLALYNIHLAAPKPHMRIKSHPTIRTISDSEMQIADGETELPRQVDKQVKKVVEKYLPGLKNAKMQVTQSDETIVNKSGKSLDTHRYVVTLNKSFDQNEHTVHRHFARMTFNKTGKLVKFTTSR